MLDLAKTAIEPKSDPDFPGLSFAYRFRDSQAEPLNGRDIPAALAEPGGWIWIHLSLVDIYARNWINKSAPLPERAREICCPTTSTNCSSRSTAASRVSLPI